MFPFRLPLRCSFLLAIILSCLSFWAGLLTPAKNSYAGDWPQILGPTRDGQAVDEKPLAADWKATPPKVLWRVPASSGYAGASIVAGTAYLFDRKGPSERLTAVQLTTGKQLWQASWKATYRSSMDPDSGPRAVPTIIGNKAVCYGAAGDLVCIDCTNGKVLWEQALRKQFSAEDGYFGAGCSPLVIGKVVIVNIGSKEAGIVGVDLESGKTLWKSTKYDSSYSSAIAVEVAGQPAALVVTRLRTVLLNAKNGNVFSEVDFGARGPTVNAATPIRLSDDLYLLTASYGVGTKLLQIEGAELREVFADRTMLASQYNTPVRLGKFVLGSDGREDMGQASLRLLNIKTKSIEQELPLPGATHLIAVGQQALTLSTNGSLKLLTLEANKLIEQARFALPSDASQPQIYRSIPAFSEHIYIARGTRDGQSGEFVALELP